MTHHRYNKFRKNYQPPIGIYLGKDFHDQDLIQLSGYCKVKADGVYPGQVIKSEDLGELTGIHVTGTLPIPYSTYKSFYEWCKSKKTAADDLHEFMMNLPWPFPKIETPTSFWHKCWEDYKRDSIFEREYNCSFVSPCVTVYSYVNNDSQLQHLEMIDIESWFQEPEDECLPGTKIPTIEEYDIPIPIKYCPKCGDTEREVFCSQHSCIYLNILKEYY